MREGRRGFLAKTAGGVAAALGLLWPSTSWAFFRRRGKCSSSEPCLPGSEVGGPFTVADKRSPLTLRYPDFTVNSVPGGGGFYVWGYFLSAAGVALAGADVTWTGAPTPAPSGTLLSPAPTTSVPLPANTSTFAFRFDSIPTGVMLTLSVYYKDSGGTKRTGDQAFFQCIG